MSQSMHSPDAVPLLEAVDRFLGAADELVDQKGYPGVAPLKSLEQEIWDAIGELRIVWDRDRDRIRESGERWQGKVIEVLPIKFQDILAHEQRDQPARCPCGAVGRVRDFGEQHIRMSCGHVVVAE